MALAAEMYDETFFKEYVMILADEFSKPLSKEDDLALSAKMYNETFFNEYILIPADEIGKTLSEQDNVIFIDPFVMTPSQ